MVDGGAQRLSDLLFKVAVLLAELLDQLFEAQSLFVFILQHLLPSLALRLRHFKVVAARLNRTNLKIS